MIELSFSWWLALFCGLPLLGMAGILISNFPFFARLVPPRTPSSFQPLISILIPARNEARSIGRLLTSLQTQTYPHFQYILLDDQSQDATASIALQTVGSDPRFLLVRGQPLPQGWLGKNWACHQLSQLARGEYLLFIDADVVWQPEGLAALVARLQKTQADLLTVWPTQETVTSAERLTIPLISQVMLAYLPWWGTHYLPFSAFGAANGQCLAFRRAAYTALGGHTAVRQEVVEDVALARRTKAHRLRLRMCDGNGLLHCRMYHNWDEVRDGLAKNMLLGYGGLFPLFLATVAHWLWFVFPYLWLMGALLSGSAWLPPFTLILLGWFLRLVTAVATRQRWVDAFLLPVSVLLFTRIAWQSYRWHVTKQNQWKGRPI